MDNKMILLHLIVLIVCVRWAESNQTVWSPHDLTKTRDWVNKFALLRPFDLWPNATIDHFQTLDLIKDCNCPRLYWPCCAYTMTRNRKRGIKKNGKNLEIRSEPVTYVNACIAHCANATVMRPAPCITYRRDSGSANNRDALDSLVGKNKVAVPSSWNVSDETSEQYRSTHNITLNDIRVILKALPDCPNHTDTAEASAYIDKVADTSSDQVVSFNDTMVDTNNPDEIILDVAQRYNLLI